MTTTLTWAALKNPIHGGGRGVRVRVRAGSPARFGITRASSANDGGGPRRPPAEEFAPLAAAFRRRILVGAGSAVATALGANFVGLTSYLLGFEPELGRRLRVDTIYPIAGYKRCLDSANGFEFIYPADWVGDSTLLYRTIGREESMRQLDLPPLDGGRRPQRRNVNEPIVAFGPPGSIGELNVSVIVSPVPPTFSIEAFGDPRKVGEAVVRTVADRGPEIEAKLVESRVRRDHSKDANYYLLEFAVESPSFRRHNVAVCCAHHGKLFTLNAQAPESAWMTVREDFYKMGGSFSITL